MADDDGDDNLVRFFLMLAKAHQMLRVLEQGAGTDVSDLDHRKVQRLALSPNGMMDRSGLVLEVDDG